MYITLNINAEGLIALGGKPVPQSDDPALGVSDRDNAFWILPPADDELDGKTSLLYLRDGNKAVSVDVGDINISIDKVKYVKPLNALYIYDEGGFGFSRVSRHAALASPEGVIIAAPEDYKGIGLPSIYNGKIAMFIVQLENGNANMLLLRKVGGEYRKSTIFPADFNTLHNIGMPNEKTSVEYHSGYGTIQAGEPPDVKVFSLKTGKITDAHNMIRAIYSFPATDIYMGLVTKEGKTEIYLMPAMSLHWVLKSAIEGMTFPYKDYPGVCVIRNSRGLNGLLEVPKRKVLAKAKYVISVSEPPTEGCILLNTAQVGGTVGLFDLRTETMPVPDGIYETAFFDKNLKMFFFYKDSAMAGFGSDGKSLHTPDAAYDTKTRSYIDGNVKEWAIKNRGVK